MDAKRIIEEFQDHLAPRLDAYEQAIYLYILRHSRLQGIEETTIGFKSARKKMAFGIGEQGKPMAERTCYEKLQSLASKGCLKILGTERSGTRIRLLIPSEMEGVIPKESASQKPTLEEMDFFNDEKNRLLILAREKHACFYCQRKLSKANYVIEHVTSRPVGDNTYRNVVAACWDCNNRKGNTSARDFLRDLYRRNFLSARESEERIVVLERLINGEIKPSVD